MHKIVGNILLATTLILLSSFYPPLTKNARKEPVSSQIIETKVFADILNYIQPNTLVILDIDDTLIEAKQTIGTDAWFRWRIDFYKKNGLESTLAFDKALLEWASVQCHTQVKLTEPGIDSIVRKMQEDNVPLMCLTTRASGLSTRTIELLNSVNIDMARTALVKDKILFLNPHEVVFRDGILFTGGAHKGTSLFIFLEQIKHLMPLKNIEQIVFINDKASHLADMQVSCEKRNIPFIGLRYGITDERVCNFCEITAQHQFDLFSKLISDDEAHINIERQQGDINRNHHARSIVKKVDIQAPPSIGI